MENQDFNYEKVFMGVFDKKKKNYKRTFKDDYRLKLLTELLKIKKGKILDIGCGGGITTESFAYYYPSADVYGCDVSKAAIKYAQKNGSGKVKYKPIISKELPYASDFFDACVCLDVLEHVSDEKFFLKEVRRILKKNGKFFLLVPCEGQPFTHTWLWQKIKIGQKMTFKRYGHIHPEFTHSSVKQLLTNQGFKIQTERYSEHILFQLISVFFYFIPLELMNFFLGRKSDNYTDSGVIRNKKKIKKYDPVLFFRNIWLLSIKFLRYLTFFEIDVMKKQPFAGWKLIVLAVKK